MYPQPKDSRGTVFLFQSGSIFEAPKGATHFVKDGEVKVAKAANTDLEAKAASLAMAAKDTNASRGVSLPHGDQVVERKGGASPEQPSVDPREDHLSKLPQHLRLGAGLPWWQRVAPDSVWDLICQGVRGPWLEPPPRERYQEHSAQELQLYRTILRDYLTARAARELSPKDAKE